MVKFYVTTPIYYINDVPSVGSSYPTIIADILARWHGLKGDKTFFLTGLDENSQKTVEAAKKNNFENINDYADFMAKKWKEIWKLLNISYDGFIRTTEARHKKVVKEFFMKVYDKGDVYKGEYHGSYCKGCEAFLTESDLVGGRCPYHQTIPEDLGEENYFFKLSEYQDKILEHIKRNPNFIKPKSRRNEVINFVKKGLKDISISRPNEEWGIEIPIDKPHKFWVWFDALTNYISGSEGNWPATLHIVGKDILRFHAIQWVAMLMSADYRLPNQIFGHGFFTVNGQKMSKSLGNVIDPVYLVKKYGVDPLRYFLVREIPFGEDGDFSEKGLVNRLNGELVNDLGNLVSRVISLAVKFKGKIEGKGVLKVNVKEIDKLMENLELHHALEKIWEFIGKVNKYVDEKEPWKLKDKELGDVLYNLVESLRFIGILINAFMPEAAEKINKQLGVKAGLLKDCTFKKFNGKIEKGKHLFERVK